MKIRRPLPFLLGPHSFLLPLLLSSAHRHNGPRHGSRHLGPGGRAGPPHRALFPALLAREDQWERVAAMEADDDSRRQRQRRRRRRQRRRSNCRKRAPRQAHARHVGRQRAPPLRARAAMGARVLVQGNNGVEEEREGERRIAIEEELGTTNHRGDRLRGKKIGKKEFKARPCHGVSFPPLPVLNCHR